MSGVLYQLISEGAHKSGALLGFRPDDGSGYSTTLLQNYVPQCENRFHTMFDRVIYTISVVGTAGTAPTAWSIGGRFEQYIQHTVGYQNQFPTWAPLSISQMETCIQEGEGFGGEVDPLAFGTIATSTTIPDFATSGVLPSGLSIPAGGATAPAPVLLAARVTQSRTIVNQLGGMRIRFNPQITGGDATTQIQLTVTAQGIR